MTADDLRKLIEAPRELLGVINGIVESDMLSSLIRLVDLLRANETLLAWVASYLTPIFGADGGEAGYAACPDDCPCELAEHLPVLDAMRDA